METQNDTRSEAKGMFGIIKGIKGLFKTEKAIEQGATLANTIARGIDTMFFTEQEKAEFRLKASEIWLKAMDKSAEESTARSVTRRILSVLILSQYCIFLYLVAVLWPINKEWALTIFDIVKHMWPIVVSVIAFYFGPYFLSYLFGGKNDNGKAK
jgi:hypothetical protein